MTVKALHILLADDDHDDRVFFSMALQSLAKSTRLETVVDGEKLMVLLVNNIGHLPDVLFLDHNMPRKNGEECLLEIKQNPLLRSLPVIIYSTSLREEIADAFYESGAHYYVKKCNLDNLSKTIEQVLSLLLNNPGRPSRDNFILVAQAGLVI